MTNEFINSGDGLFSRVSALIEQSRQHVARAINTAMVTTYFEIGRYIVEDEQGGKNRAAYGKEVLKDLSLRLTEQFGKGWSIETLKRCRLFYKVYAAQIGSTVQTQLQEWIRESEE